MMPFANETITLIRRTEVTSQSGKRTAVYTSFTLRACTWRRQTIHRMNDSYLIASETITARVPFCQGKPCVGDVMIKGEYTEQVTSAAQIQEIIESRRTDGGAFVVAGVTDDTVGIFPHYKAVSG